MGFGAGSSKSYWGRFIRVTKDSRHDVANSVTNRAFIAPLSIPRKMTIDELSITVDNPSGNIIGGIYADNGDTPVGASLVLPGSTKAVASPTVFSVNKQLSAGVFWLVIMFDSALAVFSTANNRNVFPDPYNGCFYDNPSGFVLRDPCPTVTVDNTISPHVWLRILSVDG